jgi:arylsulfatase
LDKRSRVVSLTFRRRLAALAASTAILGHAAAGLSAPAASPPAAPRSWKNYPQRPAAPKGAPNVLLVLTDDVGFGASSTFGGPIPTPVLDSLARNGLRYNAFHTTAMCSPTRAALLTGRNHHAVGYGAISNVALDEPGYSSAIPKSAATVGRVLRDAGYDTAWFGKNHNTPEWELGPMGPFDRWPNGLGFDYFYGFNAAMTDQRTPTLTENRNDVQPPNTPDYYLDRDLSDRMIHWLGVQRAVGTDRPFFAYLAPGTMHSPQQAPPEWIAKYKGRFDEGWDKMREEIFARQKKLGIIPADTVLTPRPAEMPAWDSLTPEVRKLYARMMEVGAAQLAYFDYQFGRVIEELRRTGQLDSTLIIFCQGDNGSSLETFRGTTNEGLGFLNLWETDEDMLPRVDEIGSAATAGQYPVGWGWALNAPLPWGKQVASHLGGLRDGMVISWPERIRKVGGIRTQFSHVNDIAPTIYEAAGITPPDTVDGVKQQPLDGVSLIYSFDDAKAPERHREQYFEMLGNRSYYKDGWLAASTPGAPPWTFSKLDPNSFAWELYDLRHDFSQSKNLAVANPAKRAELRSAFDAAAQRNHVYPLAGDLMGRSIDQSLRPRILPSSGSVRYVPGETRYPLSAWPTLVPGWTATTRLSLDHAGRSGTLFAHGTRFGGMALSLEQGVPTFRYDPTGRARERVIVSGTRPLATGDHRVAVRFSGSKAPFRVALVVDGQEQASASIDRLTRVRGEAFVGRGMIDAISVQPCDCGIRDLTIER